MRTCEPRRHSSELFVFVLVTVLTVAVIVLVQEGQRRIPVQYGEAGRRDPRQPHGGRRRAERASALPRRLGGHDPVDLRQQFPDLSGYDCQLLRELAE